MKKRYRNKKTGRMYRLETELFCWLEVKSNGTKTPIPLLVDEKTNEVIHCSHEYLAEYFQEVKESTPPSPPIVPTMSIR